MPKWHPVQQLFTVNAVVQLDFCEAKRMLQHAVSQAATSYSAYRSGLVRFEVCPTA